MFFRFTVDKTKNDLKEQTDCELVYCRCLSFYFRHFSQESFTGKREIKILYNPKEDAFPHTSKIEKPSYYLTKKKIESAHMAKVNDKSKFNFTL